MKKHKVFVTIPEQENWINQIQAQGYRLIKVHPYTAGYTFEKVEPGTTSPTVRLDYRQFPSKQDYIEYLSLFADCGWTLIPGSKRNSYQYFVHIASNTDADIFSDDESRQALHKRAENQATHLFSLCILYFIILFRQHPNHHFWNLKELYLTPGLWEKSGSNFWLAFLFETPFVFFLYVAYKNKSHQTVIGKKNP